MAVSFSTASPVEMFKELEHLFLDIDIDKSGALSETELAELLRCIHRSEGIARPKAKLKEEVCECMQMVRKADGVHTVDTHLEFIPFVQMIARTQLLKQLQEGSKTELLSIAAQIDPNGKHSRIMAPGGVVWGLGKRAIARRIAWKAEREARKKPAGERIAALCGVYAAKLKMRRLEQELLDQDQAEAVALVAGLREEFAKYDVDRSGSLTHAELAHLLVVLYMAEGTARPRKAVEREVSVRTCDTTVGIPTPASDTPRFCSLSRTLSKNSTPLETAFWTKWSSFQCLPTAERSNSTSPSRSSESRGSFTVVRGEMSVMRRWLIRLVGFRGL